MIKKLFNNKRYISISGIFIVMISAIFLFAGSLAMPWEIQTWDGDSLDEVLFRLEHSVYASFGLLLVAVGSGFQIISLLEKEDIKRIKKIFSKTKK